MPTAGFRLPQAIVHRVLTLRTLHGNQRFIRDRTKANHDTTSQRTVSLRPGMTRPAMGVAHSG